MKQILIAGAGDFGRELFCWLTSDARHGIEFEVVGFLDDNLNALASHPHYDSQVVSTIADYQPKQDEAIVLALSSTKTKLAVAESLQARGCEFFTWIHATAVISKFVSIGAGCIVCPQCVISADATIGHFVTINCTSNIGHDIRIGNGCTINAQCDLTGHTKIGKGVYMGSNVCILPSVEVGEFANIGAGSIVVRKVRANSTVMGPIAKRIDWDQQAAADAA